MNDIDKTLKYLKDNGRTSYKAICETVFNGKETKFHEIRSYLVAEGLITVRETDQRTLPSCFASITEKGAAKTTAKKVAAAEGRQKIYAHILNTTITAIITAVLTILITDWLK